MVNRRSTLMDNKSKMLLGMDGEDQVLFVQPDDSRLIPKKVRKFTSMNDGNQNVMFKNKEMIRPKL